MNRNPVIPFILIFVFGIGLTFLLSFKGLHDGKDLAKDKGKTTTPQTETVASAKPEDIYKTTCIGCHGDQYQGGVGPSLHGVGKKYTKQQIIGFITKGKGGIMPPGLVSPDKAAAMADWVSKIK